MWASIEFPGRIQESGDTELSTSGFREKGVGLYVAKNRELGICRHKDRRLGVEGACRECGRWQRVRGPLRRGIELWSVGWREEQNGD